MPGVPEIEEGREEEGEGNDPIQRRSRGHRKAHGHGEEGEGEEEQDINLRGMEDRDKDE
jgi:hypothetical protein